MEKNSGMMPIQYGLSYQCQEAFSQSRCDAGGNNTTARMPVLCRQTCNAFRDSVIGAFGTPSYCEQTADAKAAQNEWLNRTQNLCQTLPEQGCLMAVAAELNNCGKVTAR